MKTLAQPTVALPGRTEGVKPVTLWAAAGLGFLLVGGYAWTAWLLSGPVATSDGPTPIPGRMQFLARLAEFAIIPVVCVCVWLLLIRPWRRERSLSFDGMLTIACLTMFWQDPLLNIFQPYFSYNTALMNIGSWGSEIPGWLSPNGDKLAHPIAFTLPMYVVFIIPFAILACRVMVSAQRRWPRLSTPHLIFFVFLGFVALDLFFEHLMLLLGLYAYPGTIDWLTLWHGHHYQFPIYEAIFWPLCWTLWACLRFSRDDKGHSVAERGIDRLPVRGRARTGVRLLAVVGATQAVFLIGYNVPIAILSLYQSSWPADITSRSYLMDELCGSGTTVACPGPGIPIPRPDSRRVAPDGSLVNPRVGG